MTLYLRPKPKHDTLLKGKTKTLFHFCNLGHIQKQRRLLSDWLIYYPGTQALTKRAQSKSTKQRWRRKERFHHRHCFIACSRVLGECCSFLLCPVIQNGRKM